MLQIYPFPTLRVTDSICRLLRHQMYWQQDLIGTYLVVNFHHGKAQQEISLRGLLDCLENITNRPLNHSRVIWGSLQASQCCLPNTLYYKCSCHFTVSCCFHLCRRFVEFLRLFPTALDATQSKVYEKKTRKSIGYALGIVKICCCCCCRTCTKYQSAQALTGYIVWLQF